MKCAACGYVNWTDAQVCRLCDAPLEAAPTQTPDRVPIPNVDYVEIPASGATHCYARQVPSIQNPDGEFVRPTPELPMVSFIEAIKLGFKNYFTFSGRATRAEFWWFYLFSVISFWGTVAIIGIPFAVSGTVVFLEIGQWLAYPAMFIFGIPQLALISRRLHDTGRSGWRWLLIFVPFGFIFPLVWLCQKGNAGPNKYDPDPRQATSPPIQDDTTAIRLNPTEALAFNDSGKVYLGKDQYEWAVKDFDEAIRNDPDLGEAYYNRGWAYQRMVKFEEAERDFAKAKELGYKP